MITRVVVDRGSGPLLSTPAPRLSWVTSADSGSWVQSAATVRVLRDGIEAHHTWVGSDSVDVEWPFTPLHARDHVRVQVRVEGVDGSTSDWSAPLNLTAAFLETGEWQARFLTAGPGPARFETTVMIDGPGVRATLYGTALGLFTADLNGVPVSSDVLSPGWSAYRRRLIHETWDVTSALKPGPNQLGLTLAGGWYTESYGFGEDHAPFYGTTPAVAAQLHLEYPDGRSQWVRTGEGWRSSQRGPLLSSGIYAGEEVDRGAEWTEWIDARILPTETAPVPEARTMPPVRRHETRAVARVITTPSGATVLDFGQNLVGRVRMTSRGAPGNLVTLRHAEVLEDGELALRPLRRATATDRYRHGGEGAEVWEPEFTFHGFRYVQVDGVDELRAEDFEAVVIHSDLRRTGYFESSDALLNRLHENVVWSMRGNMLALPTDCPQRDERLGWTGDVQVFAPTAAFLYDVDAFLGSWLTDLALEQEAADGVVPVVIPWVLGWEPTEVAAWGDAATVVPSVLLERFGDRTLLAQQLPSMRAWADRLVRRSAGSGLIEGGFQFGDWLDPTAPPEHPERAATSADLIASAWYVRSLDLVSRALHELDRPPAEYAAVAERARASFRRRHLRPDGRLSSDTPTAYALAICFGLLPDIERDLGDRLAELVRIADHHITTGFVGTPLVLDALTSTGHHDDAVDLLLQRGCPSWLYPVTMGATTVWERWDSMRPDGSLNPGEMTSFNHYALGSVADWMHRRLAGLAPAAPGYRTLRIAPVVTSRLDHARAELDTVYGSASAGWARSSDGSITVSCTIPTGTTAVVELPDGSVHHVGAGSRSWTV